MGIAEKGLVLGCLLSFKRFAKRLNEGKGGKGWVRKRGIYSSILPSRGGQAPYWNRLRGGGRGSGVIARVLLC